MSCERKLGTRTRYDPRLLCFRDPVIFQSRVPAQAAHLYRSWDTGICWGSPFLTAHGQHASPAVPTGWPEASAPTLPAPAHPSTLRDIGEPADIVHSPQCPPVPIFPSPHPCGSRSPLWYHICDDRKDRTLERNDPSHTGDTYCHIFWAVASVWEGGHVSYMPVPAW